MRVLSLFVAVSERALLTLDELDPPCDATTRADVERARTSVYGFLLDGRFRGPPAETPDSGS